MHRRLTCFAAATIGLTSLATVPQTASAAPSSLTCLKPVGRVVTCTSATPGATTFTVPAGVRSLGVRLVGAAGGAGEFSYTTDEDNETHEHSLPAAGGLGAELRARVYVGDGRQLYLFVGGRGHAGGFDLTGAQAGLGGVNGGGAGGALGSQRYQGGGGGGASDLRVDADGLRNRILVAAGGGGAGAGNGEPLEGGDHDQDATSVGKPDDCAGGSGHSRRAGLGVIDGLAGLYGAGGAGSPSEDDEYHAGGGGGGGYGGGGGGAVSDDQGCGGGGGSSYVRRGSTVRGSSSTVWTTTAPPSVTLTYLLPSS